MLKKAILLSLCILPTVQAAELKAAPKCADKKVIEVLSNAFAQQGKATGVDMAVKSIKEIKQFAHYPDKKIRQCGALVITASGGYDAHYSIAVQVSGSSSKRKK